MLLHIVVLYRCFFCYLGTRFLSFTSLREKFTRPNATRNHHPHHTRTINLPTLAYTTVSDGRGGGADEGGVG